MKPSTIWRTFRKLLSMTEVLLPSPLKLNGGNHWYTQIKCRLDRMERRMSLLRQTDTRVDCSPTIRDSLRSTTPASVPRESCGRGQKRKSSLEPQSLTKRFSTGVLRRETQTGTDRERTSRAATASPSLTSVSSTSRRTRLMSERLDCSAAKTAHNQNRPEENTDTDCTDDDSSGGHSLPKVRNFFRKKWQADTITATEALLRRQQLRRIVFRRTLGGCKDNFLHTKCMYYVTENKELEEVSCISPVKPNLEQLKVPSWRIHNVPTGYQLEGTENLDDEIFLKRHQKLEQEERRRKRWDNQRMREQHLYEKLQGRGVDAASRSDHDTPCHTFQPDPDEVKYIEINDKIPVSAFGYPIPSFKPTEFRLPWFDLEKRDRLEKRTARNKKHR